MTNKKALLLSIILFMIVAIITIMIILGKGHIGSYALVNTDATEKTAENNVIPKLEISLDKKYIASTKKETSEIKATIDGEEILEGITYESSDNTIAKIEDGKVVAVKEGKAVIKANYEGIEATADVNVIIPMKTMKFTSTNSVIHVGKELQMKLQVTPSDASIDTLEYSSSDEKIATVNHNGIVTGVSAGKVTITVTDVYTGNEKSVNLTIKK